jgi:hypothetical protein
MKIKSIMFLIAALAVSINALPVYLTFEGNIYSSSSTSTITAPDAGPATIIFRVDLDGDGWYTHTTDGEAVEVGDLPGTNRFLVDYVSGPTFIGGSGSPELNPNYLHYGEDYSADLGDYTYLYGSPIDQSLSSNFIFLYIHTTGSVTFELGQSWEGGGRAYEADWSPGDWRGNFTLTAISDVAPDSVPEPGSMVLFGLGLVSLVGVIKRRTNIF